MADNNIDDEVEQIKKQLAELGINYDENIRNLKKRGKSEEDAIKETKKLAVTFAESAKLYKKSAAEIEVSIKGFRKSMADGEASVDDLAEELSTLREQINKTSDQGKKKVLLDAKADLEAMNARNQASKALKDGVFSMAGALTAGAAKAWAGAAGQALKGGDSFDVASSMMTAGVDLINTANQGSANSLKSFGAATAGAGGTVGRLGIAASIVGEAFGGLSAITSELAKAGIGFMLTQTKQLIAGFQSMSAAGALYSGGMTAMTDTALSAHMTLELFSKAVSANTANLSKTGLGVGEASKRMALSMQAGGEKARNGMFALGMGMEEQADAYANTMANLAGPTGKLKASNAEVAAQTQEYAQNLKIISDITGEDVKAKQQAIRQETDTLFMKQKIADMEPKQRAEFNNMLLNMNKDQRQALAENMKYGGVISANLAASQSLSPGIRKANDEFFQAYKDGSASAQKGRDIQSRNSEEIIKDAKNQREISIATSGIAVDVSKSMASNWDTASQYTVEGKKAAEEAAKKLQEEGKGGGAVELMKQQQDMAVRMQEIALTHLPAFKTALEKSYEAAMKAVEALDSLATAVEENPWKALLISLAAPILQVLALIGPSLLKGFRGAGAGGSMQNGQWKSGPGGPAGPGGPGSMYEAPHPAAGPGGAGTRYAAPKEGLFKRGLNAVKGVSGIARGVGIAGAVIGTGMAAKDLYDTEQDTTLTKGEKREKQGGIVGGGIVGAGGAIAGAKMGAMLGAYGGPVGIAIGGLLGAGIGYYIGQKGGDIVGKAIMKDKSANSTVATATSVAASGASAQLTAPKPLASQTSQNLAAEQTKLYGAVVDPAAAKKAAMEKPVASANPAEQQQITILQTILATLQKNNHISSGILQNSY